MAELTDREERTISTPFGDPSGAYVLGTLRGRRVAFLARHGAGHRLMPSELNFRANIYGFKTLGVERILSASAVGSLKEAYPPLDIVVPDQFVDRTKGRISTFFGNGIVAHVGFAHPVCGELSGVAHAAALAVGARAHLGGTYAREAEICYATLALVTDYDGWHPDHDSVSVELIVANLLQNAKTAQRIIAEAVGRLPADRACACRSALATAIITRPEAIPARIKQDLAPIIGKYVK
jgi:5'-methylthioadenosine phosphorylase